MSNGESESSVAIAQGLARTLKDHVEFKIEKMINPKSPLLPWLVDYVGILYAPLSFDEKSKDGMTPFRKLKGRDRVISLPSFGECVDYRVRTQHKLEARWDIGIYLGIRLHATEKIIGTPQGVVVVQSIRRKPADQQWNADLIEKLVGTPWAPSPGKQKNNQEALELPEAVSIGVEQPAVEPKPVESAEMKPHSKRVYLRQTDFDKLGYSAQCRACALLRLGMDRQGILHTEECRLRMVQRLQETEYGRKRIQIAEKREREAKEETEKGKKLRVPELPEVQSQDNPGGPAPGSGIKRPAPDPPEDPRLEPDPSGTQLDTPMEESAGSAQASTGTKRVADEAGVTVEPTDGETAITNLLLSHRKGFLGALHAKLQEPPEVLPVCGEQFDIDPETPWYYDDVSGKPLDTQMVQAARREECQVIQTMGVWEPIPRPKNEKVISTRWVDVNKGDEQRPKYRSRLVARELKAKS